MLLMALWFNNPYTDKSAMSKVSNASPVVPCYLGAVHLSAVEAVDRVFNEVYW